MFARSRRIKLCRLAPLLLLCLAGATPPAAAWAPETRLRMVDEAIRLMPASLRLALESNRTAVRRGLLEPMTQENEPGHRAPWLDGTLHRQIELEAAALDKSLRQGASFETIARGFGRLAHFVTDAGFPPAMTSGDEKRFRHFTGFCESRRERFPFVFYGHGDEQLDAGRYAEYSLAAMQRAREDDGRLAAAYAAAGDPPHPSAFDDRSVPFALGSLAYSRGITDVVRIWLTVWGRGGGDTGRTPYLEKTTDTAAPADSEADTPEPSKPQATEPRKK